MSQETSPEPLAVRQRSRPVCYTCRIRKVRCEGSSSNPENEKEPPSKCSNCQRLGFQCQWRAPESGEHYVPPPKRRRTIGQRLVRSAVKNKTMVPGPTTQTPDGESSGQQVTASTRTLAPVDQDLEDRPEENNYELNPLPNYQPDQLGDILDFNLGSDQLGDIALDFDLGSDFLDLNLAGEGLDFIPLPAVDPSILQLSEPTSAPSSYEWPLSTHGHEVSQPEVTQDESTTLDRTGNSFSTFNEDNRQLIQHYLEVIKGYSKVDDRSKNPNNLFVSAFAQSLSFPPLFHAILAFSASHLSIEDPSYVDQAKKFDQLAEESFEIFRKSHSSEIDGLLSAIFVRVKKVHVMGASVDSFLGLLATAIDVISTKEGEEALEDSSSLTRRIILRLAILDARSACFRLGGGVLIERLRRSPSLSFIFDLDTHSHNPPLGPIMNLLRADIFRKRVADFELQLHKQLEGEFITSRPIRTDEVRSLYTDIQHAIGRCENQATVKEKGPDVDNLREEVLDSTNYGFYLELSALHSTLLYLYQVYPLPNLQPELSISKVLQCQLKIQYDPSRANSPSSIIPSSLFLAGLATSDPIHRDWVLNVLKKGEVWGSYVTKTRHLLEAMCRTKSQGNTLDICGAMDQFTGRFII